MKTFVLSADANLLDTAFASQIANRLPNAVDMDSADVVIVVAANPNYVFNPLLRKISKPWVMVDFTEHGWYWKATSTPLFGRSPDVYGGSYLELDQFAKDFPPFLYFKRELVATDRSETVLPIEYLCYYPAEPIQTRREFDARPIEVLFNWGPTNPIRFQLHGDIFKNAHNIYHVVSQWDHLDRHLVELGGRTWASILSPYYGRAGGGDIVRGQQRSKISVSLPGCGVKCFRHNEANVNCIMALPYDNLAWTYPFDHGVNCIRLDPENMWLSLYDAVHRTDLYKIYLASQKTADKYRQDRYVSEYFLPAISRAYPGRSP